ncbi:MAG: sugar transferase [Paludibacteraceae bacterium]|nr:sugar transferase [Paludibacteraceae bacterium]
MTRYRKIQLTYLAIDFVSSVLVWLSFLLFRWMVYEGRIFSADTVLIPAFNLWRFMVLYPVGCLLVYYLSGYYLRPLTHKPGQEFLLTLLCSVIISIGAFFIIIIDDPVDSYLGYYTSLFVLFSLQLLLSWLPRLAITLCVGKSHRQKNTVVVGRETDAQRLMSELGSERKLVAVIAPEQLDRFHSMKQSGEVDEVIVNLDAETDEQKLYRIISLLFPEQVQISFPARVYDMLTGAARIDSLTDEPLVTVTAPSMTDWQLCFKRAFDILFASVALCLLSPLMLVIALLVKLSSKGRVIYRQERVGLYGRPFNIIKFRTMVENAEPDTPLLSSADDPRITRVGHWLRKYRLDELPQFWNILRGDMSMVGPRPERRFYINKIEQRAPYYCLLYKIRPGLTSWGPIRVGYTDTLEKMIQRLNYDIVYMENMSLRLDLKIMIYTIKVLLDGKGQ